jgi:endonuclease G, mitochondrial
MKFFRLIIFICIIFTLSGCTTIEQSRFEFPLIKEGDKLIIYDNYALIYNVNHNLARWAAYSLTSDEINDVVDRKSHYKTDTLFSYPTAKSNDYKGSGYDRGHLVPARDMLFDNNASIEVNYITNITPQTPGFNRGIWRSLENDVRKWANMYDSVMVVCGPIIEKNLPKIGKENKISIPEKYFKALLVHNDTVTETIAFVIPNYKKKERFKETVFDYALTIDSLEVLTELDLWPMLPKRIESRVESEYNPVFWQKEPVN